MPLSRPRTGDFHPTPKNTYLCVRYYSVGWLLIKFDFILDNILHAITFCVRVILRQTHITWEICLWIFSHFQSQWSDCDLVTNLTGILTCSRGWATNKEGSCWIFLFGLSSNSHPRGARREASKAPDGPAGFPRERLAASTAPSHLSMPGAVMIDVLLPLPNPEAPKELAQTQIPAAF